VCKDSPFIIALLIKKEINYGKGLIRLQSISLAMLRPDLFVIRVTGKEELYPL
jgi:hypothetical protein